MIMNFRQNSLLLFFCFVPTLPRTESAISSLKCHQFESQNDCKKLSPPADCTFCFDSCLKSEQPRCDSPRALRKVGCASFNLGTNYGGIDLAITPPNCTLWVPVVIRRRRNLTVSFEPRRGHPLDFYYLMDMSGSMGPQKEALISLSSQLLETLKERSTDFRIGFGTFVDKPPPGPGGSMDYSFRNNMPLTDAVDGFVDKVREARLFNGGDFPESHGDALAQVAECTSKIGWRKNAEHVVLLATDVHFHVAGDGGINAAPYVPGCYLDAAGYYTEQTSMDYPSIAQLAAATAKNSITTIFASAAYTEPFYTDVSKTIKPSTFANLDRASNIVKLIVDEFNKLSSRMEIESVVEPKKDPVVKLRYFSKCLGVIMKETAVCNNLPSKGGNITFVVEVELPSCPIGVQSKVKLQLRPVGLPASQQINLGFMC